MLLCSVDVSIAQLSQYIISQEDNQTLYDIKQGMEPYLDNLKATQDSATFYSEGGEYVEYMKFIKYWEPRLYPHGDFSKIFDANNIYYKSTQDNYQYFSDKPWQEKGPLKKPNGIRGGIGPVEYLSIFDDGKYKYIGKTKSC